MPKEYRSRTRITLDLLRAIASERGIGRTRLLAAANLSTDRLHGYLGELIERGLVAETLEEGRRTLSLTPAGRALLAELDRIDRFMADFGMSL